MAGRKSGNLRTAVLSAVRKSGSSGIKQKDLETSMGISKSYCSEIISELEMQGRIKRVYGTGRSVIVYATDFFPGTLEGSIRIGMLKSSEYIPALTIFFRLCESNGLQGIARFYNSTFELLNDLRFHSIDFCLAPTSSLVLSAVLGGDIKILFGLASGGSGVIAHDKSENREILSTEASTMMTMALWSTGKGKVSGIKAFENPSDGMRLYNSGSCGRIAIWEPYFSGLASLDENEILVKYEEVLGNFPCCSAATSLDFFHKKRDLAESFAENYTNINLTEMANDSNYRKALGLLARGTKFKIGFIEKTLDNYDFRSAGIKKADLSRFGISFSGRQEEEIFLEGSFVDD